MSIQPYQPKLTRKSLDTNITCECFEWEVPETNAGAGYIVFKGDYRYGSIGYPDGLFIRLRISELWEWPPVIQGLVVDFRELNYTWGNNIYVPQDRYKQYPYRIVVSDSNREALKGILGDQFFVSDLNMAFAEIKNLIQQMK